MNRLSAFVARCGTHSPGPLPGADVAVEPTPNPPSVGVVPATDTAGESTRSPAVPHDDWTPPHGIERPTDETIAYADALLAKAFSEHP